MTIYKLVFQLPYDPDSWDEIVAEELGEETPRNRHGPHIRAETGRVDSETGDACAKVRCKTYSAEELRRQAAKVMERIEELVGLEG